jgi:hypothetical protein
MTRRLLAAAWVGLGVAVVPQTTDAQSWRTLTASRQVHGESRLEVDIEFASGTLRIQPGARESLFRVDAKYDEDRFESSTSFDPRTARLSITVQPDELDGDLDLDDDSPQYLDLALSPAVPVSLDLKFGAAKSAIELGGLAVDRVAVKTGASETAIGFERPNRIACEELSVAVGAAEFTVYGIGNSRCRHVKLAGGAGDVTLDFTGAWPVGFQAEAEIIMGFGGLTLRIPENVGVELTMNRLFASFEHDGFEKRGSHWVSANFDDAQAVLRLQVRAILGDVSVDWVERR